MAGKANEKNTHKKHSFLVGLFVVVLCTYFAISLFSVNKKIRDTDKEIAEVNFAIAEQKKENDELRKKLNSENKDEYVESVARDKLGYVMPGERVYYDVSVTD